MRSKRKNTVFDVAFVALHRRFFVDGMLIPKNDPKVLIDVEYVAPAKSIKPNIRARKAMVGVNPFSFHIGIGIVPIIL